VDNTITITPVMERAKALLDRGFSLTVLQPRSKEPLLPFFGPRSRIRDLGQLAGVPEDANLGVCADENFLVLESDNEAQLRLVLKNSRGVQIPPTFTSRARDNRPHFYFRQTARTLGLEKNLALPGLFELRCSNQYVVGPGSIHPKGPVYAVVNGAEVIPFPDELLDALLYLRGEVKTSLPTVTLGKKLGEGEGRHYALLHLAAKVWNGDVEETFQEVQKYNLAHHDPPKEEWKVRSIVNWFEDEGKEPTKKMPVPLVVGAPTEPDPKTLDEALQRMNDHYCYVDEVDVVVRLDNAHMYKADNFRSGGHMANRFFFEDIVDADGNIKRRRIPLGKKWLECPKRREVARMVYEPGQPRFLTNAINRWQGMGVKPVAGNIAPWTRLLEQLIPDPTARRWFERWCAYPLQHLGTKMSTAVVLWSVQQGTGKTTVYRTLREIYGRNAVAITESHLHAQFNEWALDKQFVYADEISGGDKRSTSDYLKELVTGHEIRVNQKFQPEISIRNCMQFLFSSNHPNAFFLEPTDRRFFVAEVGAVPREFFNGYYQWLNSGGAAHVYGHLLALPMGDFNPHSAPPMTGDKQAMIDLGRSDVERWLEDNREFVGTGKDWLDEYRGRDLMRQRQTNLSESGMASALKRCGGQLKRVKQEGKVTRLWSLNLREQDSPQLWLERYQASRNDPPSPASIVR
jgi:hypothetical protein